MAKKKKIEAVSDEQLVAAIQESKAKADAHGRNLLVYQREQSIRQYQGLMTDDLAPTTGMSSVIMNAVRPTVNTLTTYVAKPYSGNKEPIVFTPSDPKLAPAAQQATKLLNHILMKENEGFNLIETWARAAALYKTVTVKVTWDNTPVTKTKEVQDMDEDELDIYLTELDELDLDPKSKKVGDKHVVSYSFPKGMPRIEVVPPEEFLINEGAEDIRDTGSITDFVAHRRSMDVGVIQNMFPDEDIDSLAGGSAGDDLNHSYEKLNRGIFDGTYNEALRVDGQGPNRTIELTETWIKADRDGDGLAEWRHCFTIGKNLLEDEAWEGEPPFVAFSFWPIDFKFYGMSAWDVLKDYHRNKTGLMRGYLDAINQNNLFRMIADTRYIDQRLLQSGKPGIYPARPGFDPTKVMQIPKVQVTDPTGALKYLDEQIEMEVGINPRTGAISSDVEKSGNDAAKTSMVIDNASAKVEIYARRFAEAMRQVTWLTFDLLVKHAEDNTVKAMIDVVTPGQPFMAAEHKLDKTALSVTVGLGHLTTEQKINALSVAKQAQHAI